DGDIWNFPVSTSVPRPEQAAPPVWVAAHSPETMEWAVGQGCNIQGTPLMKSDEEVEGLMNKFNAALVANQKIEKRHDVMGINHTHVHSEDQPEGWKPAAEAINKFYRTFSAWAFGNEAPFNGFLEPQPEERFAERP